jgi:hypothetical protein
MFPPVSLPYEVWIQPVMEGPCRAGSLAGRGSPAVGRSEPGLVAAIRRLMILFVMPDEPSLETAIKNRRVFVNR